VQREFNVKVHEVQNGSDKQMGEICMMIEELAKVVRSFESQISNVKALNENILSTKLDAGYVHDFEKLVQAQITLAMQKHEEKTQQVIAELTQIKRRHTRLLSLYTTGLESQMQGECRLTLDELDNQGSTKRTNNGLHYQYPHLTSSIGPY